MKSKANYLLLFFVLVACINLYAELINHQTLIYFSKPLLISTLALWFYRRTGLKNTFSKLIFWGLIFSVGGDVLLMFVKDFGQHFFLLGLSSFLITHVLYFFAFYKYQSKKSGLLKRKVWLSIPLVFFYLLLMGYLLPDMPSAMKAPVLVYGVAIIAMALSSLNLQGKISSSVFQWLFIGVLFFVISDSIIALNKFKSAQLNIPFARLWIMSLYITGQFLITRSSITMAPDS